MVFLFRDRSDINILFIIVLSFALHFHNWITPPMVIANESDGFLAYLLIHYIRPLPGIVLIFLFQLLIISQALRLNVLLSQLKMFQQISYLPAFVYVLLTATF
ncbi:MAG: hypothetical protein ACO239_06095, partial [Sediminibacterium sp.]